MKENIPVTPSTKNVQKKRKAPLYFAISPLKMPLGPITWMDRHAHRKKRPDQHDDVSRPPFGKHQRSVKPDDQDGHRNQG
jgi:hypothetical protein